MRYTLIVFAILFSLKSIAYVTDSQLVTKPFGSASLDWSASSGVTPLATATSTLLIASAGSGLRNYLSGCQIYNTSATVSTNVSILDGASVKWTGYLPAMTVALVLVPSSVQFITPIRGSAATAMNIQLGTTGASVYYNCQGYQAQ